MLIFHNPPVFNALRVIPLELPHNVWCQKTRMTGLVLGCEKMCADMFSHFNTDHKCDRDRQNATECSLLAGNVPHHKKCNRVRKHCQPTLYNCTHRSFLQCCQIIAVRRSICSVYMYRTLKLSVPPVK